MRNHDEMLYGSGRTLRLRGNRLMTFALALKPHLNPGPRYQDFSFLKVSSAGIVDEEKKRFTANRIHPFDDGWMIAVQDFDFDDIRFLVLYQDWECSVTYCEILDPTTLRKVETIGLNYEDPYPRDSLVYSAGLLMFPSWSTLT